LEGKKGKRRIQRDLRRGEERGGSGFKGQTLIVKTGGRKKTLSGIKKESGRRGEGEEGGGVG